MGLLDRIRGTLAIQDARERIAKGERLCRSSDVTAGMDIFQHALKDLHRAGQSGTLTVCKSCYKTDLQLGWKESDEAYGSTFVFDCKTCGVSPSIRMEF